MDLRRLSNGFILLSESLSVQTEVASLIFDGLMCERVYIRRLTFFSLGADSRRRWKCRVGATDRHAMALWPLSFTSRQTGRVKPGPSLIWTNAVSFRVTWAPGENAAWMTDVSLLRASINHSENSHFALVFCNFSLALFFIFFRPPKNPA